MRIKSAAGFVQGLVAAFCRSYAPPDRTVAFYVGELNQWHLTEEQWSRALAGVIKELGGDGLPEVKAILPFLDRARAPRVTGGEHHVLFSIGPLRYAIPVQDPSRAPAGPEAAVDLHLAVRDPYEAFRRPSQEEARASWRSGWQAGGGDPGKCDEHFSAFSRQDRIRRKLSSEWSALGGKSEGHDAR